MSIRAFFSRSLDKLFAPWAGWSFTGFDFLESDTLETFARWVNQRQSVFVLKVDDMTDVKPGQKNFQTPNQFARASKVLVTQPSLCMAAQWPPESRRRRYSADGTLFAPRPRIWLYALLKGV